MESKAEGVSLMVSGVDVNLSPYSLFTQVDFKSKNDSKGAPMILRKEPFRGLLKGKDDEIEITLHF